MKNILWIFKMDGVKLSWKLYCLQQHFDRVSYQPWLQEMRRKITYYRWCLEYIHRRYRSWRFNTERSFKGFLKKKCRNVNLVRRIYLWLSWKLSDLEDAATFEEYIYRIHMEKIYNGD